MPFDQRFLIALLPFIVLGSSFRVLEDLKLLARSCNPLSLSFYTITPGIYIATGALTILALWVSVNLAKKNPEKTFFYFKIGGAVLALPALVFVLTQTIVWNGVLGVLVLTLLLTVVAVLGTRFFSKTKTLFSSRMNQLVFLGQMLDASATFVSIEFFTCGEQHVLSAGIINAFGPFSFVIVKFALMLLVLYYADREVEDPKTRDFVKIIIAIIGFAPGIRDTLTLGVGTCGLGV